MQQNVSGGEPFVRIIVTSTSHRAVTGVAMPEWDTLAAVERSPDTLNGTWVFRNTRVPVAALFENLRDGATVDQFLEWFPGVTRAQVEAVLDYEAQALQATTPA